MPKIVIVKGIERCGDCPYCERMFNRDSFYCMQNKSKHDLDVYTVPDWCPLPEDKNE